jgi:ribosomal protein S27E
VICPNCGNRPLSFATFLVTLNPWRIRCVNCGATLHVGPLGYAWMAFHVVLGLALVKLYLAFAVQGVIASPAGVLMFISASLALVFITAYVIPWMFLDGVYRAE